MNIIIMTNIVYKYEYKYIYIYIYIYIYFFNLLGTKKYALQFLTRLF
jgi:hypothetical protein